ncbi:MAG TPA: methylated-DNA--[protein]-cysteine S-methyltransferase [Tepidisphaeraceae bacterium]|jgi:O-6-methylguanine DNA methyltransferase|nr:methylated-DNA--[protein]-cysteine S-methyltransferase [Tepidisphaeraceae bacterium]
MTVQTNIETPLGTMRAIADDERLLLLDFIDRNKPTDPAARFDTAAAKLATQFTQVAAADHPILAEAARQLSEYFAGERTDFSIPLAPQGTVFEQQAWNYLQSIPYGQTRSYGQQAIGLNAPKSSRAVGRANGRNGIAIVIPCHRVIGASGSLTGYGGGLDRKRWLLQHEQRATVTSVR